jgi:hypothetical protein
LLLRPPVGGAYLRSRGDFDVVSIRADAEKCRQYTDAVDTFGTKRLYEELSRQWLRLAEQAEETVWLTSLYTSAINSRRYMLYNLEREIKHFKTRLSP